MNLTNIPRRPVGLFTYGEPPERLMPQRRIRAMLGEGALQGVDFLFFAAADCDPETGTVTARRWRNGRLEAARVPLPPLVMIVANPIRDDHHRIRAWLAANAELVDDRGPDKLRQIAILEASPLAAHAIPAERIDPARAVAEIADAVGRYGGAAVKPIDGMRGGSVHFVVPAEDGRWALRTGTRRTTGALPDILGALHARIAGRLRYRDFMVQRFVRSAVGDMALSIRVDVCRTAAGGWVAMRRVARLGMTGALATNTAAGSAQMFLERFLAFSGRDPGLADAAEALALGAARVVAADPEASMIEAGVDIAVTADDRLFVIEVNAHPEANWAEQDRAVHVVAYLASRFDERRGPAAGTGRLQEA